MRQSNLFRVFLFIQLSLPSLFANAQELADQIPHFVFGDVMASDFTVTSPVVDSNSDLVVLADICHVEFEYWHGWVGLYTTMLKRVMIMNNRGLADAVMSIYYSGDDNGKGKLESLKAAVYNLDRGQVRRTDLASKDIFLDKTRGDLIGEKFAFPAARVGSIIEYTASFHTGYVRRLWPWDFQGSEPCLWSDLTVCIPERYSYLILPQGDQPLFYHSEDTVVRNFQYEEGSSDTHIRNIRWVMKDVPALHPEPFTSTLENYVAGIRFQLSMMPVSRSHNEELINTWWNRTMHLLIDPYFKSVVRDPNAWLDEDLKKITLGCPSDLEKSRKIYEFVRDHFSIVENGPSTDNPDGLKKIYQGKKSNNAGINLMLVAMLREAGISADPVLLGTRRSGRLNTKYAIMDHINYLVVRIRQGNQGVYLDASQPRLGFGKLPLKCYNGYARVIAMDGFGVNLDPDSVRESSETTVFVTNDVKDSLYATFTSTPGYNESAAIRDSSDGGGTAAMFKRINAMNPPGTVLLNTSVDSLKAYDLPVTVHYEMKFSPGEDSFIYFNPMFNEAMKENPFKSVKRLYPVELPSTIEKIYVLNMEVPRGYKIEELPKSVKLDLDNGNGQYEYTIQASGPLIQLLSKLSIKKTVFPPSEYQTLRDFYGYVVKKQAEQIVFKKIDQAAK